jgi:hypothetical protein
MPQNPKSSDFRHVYSNAIGVQYNGNELYLTIGVRQTLNSSPDDAFLEEFVVVMNAVTAKLVAQALSGVIDSAEKITGQVIPVDPAKVKMVQDIIAAAEKSAEEQKAAALAAEPPAKS